MTPIRVYIIISGSTNPPHWLPHFVLDALLLHGISYKTFVNGVAASLHRNKKGIWPQFLLMTPVCNIENFKHAREEVTVLSSYKLRDVSF